MSSSDVKHSVINRTTLRLGLVMGFVFLALFFVLPWFQDRPATEHYSATGSRVSLPLQEPKAFFLPNDGRLVAFDAHRWVIVDAHGRIETKAETGDTIQDIAVSSDGGSITVRTADSFEIWNTRTWSRTVEKTDSTGWTFHRDIRIRAFRSGNESRLEIVHPNSTPLIFIEEDANWIPWCSDTSGKLLAVFSRSKRQIRTYDARTGICRDSVEAKQANNLFLCDDGKRVFWQEHYVNYYFDFETDRKTTLSVRGTCVPRPDGSLAAVSIYGTIRLVEPDTGKEVGHIDPNAHDVRSMAWSPDGSTLLVTYFNDPAVELWRLLRAPV